MVNTINKMVQVHRCHGRYIDDHRPIHQKALLYKLWCTRCLHIQQPYLTCPPSNHHLTTIVLHQYTHRHPYHLSYHMTEVCRMHLHSDRPKRRYSRSKLRYRRPRLQCHRPTPRPKPQSKKTSPFIITHTLLYRCGILTPPA